MMPGTASVGASHNQQYFAQPQLLPQQPVGPWDMGSNMVQPTMNMSYAPAPQIPHGPPPKKFYTVQRVNGNGGNGKGDGIAGPHKHSLEESDRVKKNSVLRWLAKTDKGDRKKVPVSHILQICTKSCFYSLQACDLSVDMYDIPIFLSVDQLCTRCLRIRHLDVHRSTTSRYSPPSSSLPDYFCEPVTLNTLWQFMYSVRLLRTACRAYPHCTISVNSSKSSSYLKSSFRLISNPHLTSFTVQYKMTDRNQGGDASKKTYHKKATGNALTTVKTHSKDNDLKLYGSAFWYVQSRTLQ